jgi:hypothetical protein
MATRGGCYASGYCLQVLPRLGAIEDGPEVEVVPAPPVNLEALLAALACAAEQMGQ